MLALSVRIMVSCITCEKLCMMCMIHYIVVLSLTNCYGRGGENGEAIVEGGGHITLFISEFE